MADKVTTEVYVDVNLGFVDEDTRKLKIPNALPLNELTIAKFRTLEAKLKPTLGGVAVSFVVGDRNGAEFAGILTGDRVSATKTEFDLN